MAFCQKLSRPCCGWCPISFPNTTGQSKIGVSGGRDSSRAQWKAAAVVGSVVSDWAVKTKGLDDAVEIRTSCQDQVKLVPVTRLWRSLGDIVPKV